VLTKTKYVKVRDRKIKGTRKLLAQFGATSPTLGATKPGWKSTSVVLILSSQQTPRLQL